MNSLDPMGSSTVSSSQSGRFPFITISRQAGAGGHSLARTLLEKMKTSPDPSFQDWILVDAEMCQRMLQEEKLYVPVKSVGAEEHLSRIEEVVSRWAARRSPRSEVHHKLFEMISNLAAGGKVIFVGRGAACVTRSFPSGIHLRLVSPRSARTGRMMDIHQVGIERAQAMIVEQDEARAWLVKHYFKKDIASPLLYHVIWNTALVPIPQIADITLQMIAAKRFLMPQRVASER